MARLTESGEFSLGYRIWDKEKEIVAFIVSGAGGFSRTFYGMKNPRWWWPFLLTIPARLTSIPTALRRARAFMKKLEREDRSAERLEEEIRRAFSAELETEKILTSLPGDPDV